MQPGTSVSGIKLPGGLKGTISGPSRTEAKVEEFDSAFKEEYGKAIQPFVRPDGSVTNADVNAAMDAALGNIIARNPTIVPQNFQERANQLLGVTERGAFQRGVGGRAAGEAMPHSVEEDIAARARAAGLTGPAAIDVKQNLREQYAAGQAGARVAGQRAAQVEFPVTTKEDAIKEALARKLVPGTEDYKNFMNTYFTDIEQRKATTRHQVAEQYRLPSESTRKTLGDIGILEGIVTRMENALNDQKLGPEIIKSRGPISGRLLNAARRFGLDIGPGKTAWDIITDQARVIGVQPYLRGVRRYEFIEDARGHLPQAGDQLNVTLDKLKELHALIDDYKYVALMNDKPIASILADIKSGRARIDQQAQQAILRNYGDIPAPPPTPAAPTPAPTTPTTPQYTAPEGWKVEVK